MLIAPPLAPPELAPAADAPPAEVPPPIPMFAPAAPGAPAPLEVPPPVAPLELVVPAEELPGFEPPVLPGVEEHAPKAPTNAKNDAPPMLLFTNNEAKRDGIRSMGFSLGYGAKYARENMADRHPTY